MVVSSRQRMKRKQIGSRKKLLSVRSNSSNFGTKESRSSQAVDVADALLSADVVHPLMPAGAVVVGDVVEVALQVLALQYRCQQQQRRQHHHQWQRQ